MDKEYLEDYKAKENEEIGKFIDGYLRKDSNASYPDKSRFHKLKEPLGRACGGPIWSQIPFFGSLLIGVSPYPEDRFYQINGIEKRDFERLIDFCKDTGKVQFLINGNPESFIGLDFLAPLFEELHSPLSFSIPIQHLIEPKKINSTKLFKYSIEFDTLTALPSQTGGNYKDILKHTIASTGSGYNLHEIMIENLRYYAFLKEPISKLLLHLFPA